MAKLESRVKALERHGAVTCHKVHRIICGEDQSEDDVIDAYGREKIGPDDKIIMRVLVSPKRDEQGRMIPQQPGAKNGKA